MVAPLDFCTGDMVRALDETEPRHWPRYETVHGDPSRRLPSTGSRPARVAAACCDVPFGITLAKLFAPI